LLLGLSSTDEETFDPSDLAGGAGVPHAIALGDLTRAAAAGEPQALAEQRDRLQALIGRDAMIDALAVFANFSMMTRIADGTGTPLDEGSTAISATLRTDLGLDDLTSTRFQESGQSASGR
jgi:hypothetical protein